MGWSQAAMGQFFGTSQRVVWSIESGGQAEPGPVARLLDILDRAIRSGRVANGMSPQQALGSIYSAASIWGASEQPPSAAPATSIPPQNIEAAE